jgi:hypothetical protein
MSFEPEWECGQCGQQGKGDPPKRCPKCSVDGIDQFYGPRLVQRLRGAFQQMCESVNRAERILRRRDCREPERKALLRMVHEIRALAEKARDMTGGNEPS